MENETDSPIYDELKAEFEYLEARCHHGMALWLCDDPINHYPPDNPWDF